jgi:hypothetical protein
MKKLWILTLLALAAVSLNGCSSCGGGLFGNWFNRNDCCPPQCAVNGAATDASRYAARPVAGNHVEGVTTAAATAVLAP